MVSVLLNAEARLTFTQRLRQRSGGRIVLIQNSSIDLFVDGRKPETASSKKNATDTINALPDKPALPAHKDGQAAHFQKEQHLPVSTAPTAYTTTSGWRVRFYMGGSSRAEKENAQAAGRAFKSRFPDVPVYMHFMSPHWVCVAGDFLTRAEAEAFIHRARSVPGVRASSMSVIKSKVKVPVN